MSSALTTLTTNLALELGIGADGSSLIQTMKETAFKGVQVSDSQMTALLIVAQQYKLNPWTREIYAFPDKGGIVPVVGVDGWSRILNQNAQFDGMDFEQDEESCTCIIYRKDRTHPVKVTEYMSECKRDNAQPWKSHPKRMLRHKAMIQCARIAFGFIGIYDQDEAERIVAPAETKSAELPDDLLVEEAKNEAKYGMTKLTEWAQKLPEKQQGQIRSIWKSLKQIAVNADKNIIEAGE